MPPPDWTLCEIVSTVLIPTVVGLAGWVQWERREAVRVAQETRAQMSEMIRELIGLIAQSRAATP